MARARKPLRPLTLEDLSRDELLRLLRQRMPFHVARIEPRDIAYVRWEYLSDAADLAWKEYVALLETPDARTVRGRAKVAIARDTAFRKADRLWALADRVYNELVSPKPSTQPGTETEAEAEVKDVQAV